ncbi:class I SAM-dependent methyltransferase [Methylobacter sp.]|uniref:class I SAM-dependent methyltransferase n=1 Tax=Methylobacter sp. TaxID=2051955 RepID=UPI0012270285|nr:class I SAM-dependent methyltransferase [Methylobacter sp.]TAK61352.1 MAG: class I SAM-dependent methyltransferase [Methylobacter sp.]
MNPSAYMEMARTEDEHWWFLGRRQIIASLLSRLFPSGKIDILEVGCGTGGNLAMLSDFGRVTAVEKNSWAAEYAQNKFGGYANVLFADFLELDCSGRQFDLICAFDVLEHLQDDVCALQHMTDMLADNGRIIVTVPAYKWLWSNHDRKLHHYRRYNRDELIENIHQLPLNIEFISYFNCLLFPLALCLRCLDILLFKDWSSQTNHVNGLSNRILLKIFSSEQYLLRHARPPFGLSLLVVLRNSL